MQAGVAATTKGAGEMVQRVTDGMNPDDVVSTLSPAAGQMGSASTAASATISELDKLATEITAALRGGKPGPLVALVNQIKQPMVRVVSGLATAKTATEETITAAREMGNF